MKFVKRMIEQHPSSTRGFNTLIWMLLIFDMFQQQVMVQDKI